MLQGTIISAIIFLLVSRMALCMGDTLTLSYDRAPVTYQQASSATPVASVYLDIAWTFMEDSDSIASYLFAHDAAQYQALRKHIDTIAYHSKDPSEILALVKSRRFSADYVRLVMGYMAKNFIGVRTPSVVRLVFNAAGYLTYWECRGFATTNDGFKLTEHVLLPMKIHRSMFKEYRL